MTEGPAGVEGVVPPPGPWTVPAGPGLAALAGIAAPAMRSKTTATAGVTQPWSRGRTVTTRPCLAGARHICLAGDQLGARKTL